MVAYSGLALLTDLQVMTSLRTQDSKFFPFLFVMVFIKCCRSRWKLTLLVPCRITSFSALFLSFQIKYNAVRLSNYIQFPEFVNLKKRTLTGTPYPIQYGLFLKHYGMGGAIMAPLVTLLFLKVEQQNLVG